MKTNIIKRYNLIPLYLLISFLAITCKNKQIETEYPFERIQKEVTELMNSSTQKEIDFSELIPFEWDIMYIFKPYSLIKGIDNKLEFDWNIPENLSIFHDEIDNLLVFTKNNTVVGYIEWPRDMGDFMRVKILKYPYDSAKFILKKEKYGNQDKVFIYEKE